MIFICNKTARCQAVLLIAVARPPGARLVLDVCFCRARRVAPNCAPALWIIMKYVLKNRKHYQALFYIHSTYAHLMYNSTNVKSNSRKI